MSSFGWNDGYFCSVSQYLLQKTGRIGVKISYGEFSIATVPDYEQVYAIRAWLLSYVPNCNTS
jgi:hypothetical protein